MLFFNDVNSENNINTNETMNIINILFFCKNFENVNVNRYIIVTLICTIEYFHWKTWLTTLFINNAFEV